MEKKYFVNDVEIPNIITIFSIIFKCTGLLLNRDQYPDIHYDSGSNYIYLSISNNSNTGILCKFSGKYDGKDISEIIIRNNNYDTIIYSKNSPIVKGTIPYVNQIPLTTNEKRLESEIIQNLQYKLKNDVKNDIYTLSNYKIDEKLSKNKNKKFWKKYRNKLTEIIENV